MNRRVLLQSMGVAGAALLLPKFARAEEPLPPPAQGIRIVSEISRNHGHELALSPEEALRLLRQTKQTGMPAVISIQGSSSHPHAVELAFEDLLALFADGAILETTTVDAGHAHDVAVRMEV